MTNRDLEKEKRKEKQRLFYKWMGEDDDDGYIYDNVEVQCDDDLPIVYITISNNDDYEEYSDYDYYDNFDYYLLYPNFITYETYFFGDKDDCVTYEFNILKKYRDEWKKYTLQNFCSW